MSQINQVYIITYCNKPELFYGTSLVFGSIRIGFPTSQINIIDNGSTETVLAKIQNLAKSVDANFSTAKTYHWSLIERILNTSDTTIAIVDPDGIFWDIFDEHNDSLISGRLIPGFKDPVTNCYTMPRFHTSMLKVNPIKLRERIKDIKSTKFEWNPYQPQMIYDSYWKRYDTLASLYATIPGEKFSERDLNKYDHLFCGSHLDWILPKLGDWATMFRDIHNSIAHGEIFALKGAWKKQDTFLWQTRSLKGNSFLIGVVLVLANSIANATSEYIILIGNHGATRDSEMNASPLLCTAFRLPICRQELTH